MKAADIEARVPVLLRECLRDLPLVDDIEVKRGSDCGIGPDFEVRVALPQLGREDVILVEVKPSGEPRHVRDAVNQLLRYRQELRQDKANVYMALVAPYISPRSAEACRQAGVGYADLAGNCNLVLGLSVVIREGRPNPYQQKRPLRSVYGAKATRVLRVLLSDPPRRRKLQALADEAGVSIGLVHKVKSVLWEMEWIESDDTGLYLSRPDLLVADWVENYSIRQNTVHEFYSFDSVADIEHRVASACEVLGARYAFTGFSAGARLAPSVRYKRVMVYVAAAVERVAAEAGLKPVDSGANVWLIVPYDEGVFYNSRGVEGASVVSPVQAHLDLTCLRGRGQEGAEAILREELAPKW